MPESLALIIWLSGWFCDAAVWAYNDGLLQNMYRYGHDQKWIGEREHIFKVWFPLSLTIAVWLGTPSLLNLVGWFLLGYVFWWNVVYYQIKLGMFREHDGVFIPDFSFKDKKVRPSQELWDFILLGSLVAGIMLSAFEEIF